MKLDPKAAAVAQDTFIDIYNETLNGPIASLALYRGINAAIRAYLAVTGDGAFRFAEPAENFVNGTESLGNVVGDDGLEPPTSSV